MTIQHKNIAEADLHENKGASTASANQFLVADGLGASSFQTKFVLYTIAITPALVAANTTAEQTFTLSGLVKTTDTPLVVIKPTAQAGLGIVGWRISADNTIAITYSNNTAAGITPTAAETYSIFIYRV